MSNGWAQWRTSLLQISLRLNTRSMFRSFNISMSVFDNVKKSELRVKLFKLVLRCVFPSKNCNSSRKHGNNSFFASILGYFAKLFRTLHKYRNCENFKRYFLRKAYTSLLFEMIQFCNFCIQKILLCPQRLNKSSQALLGAWFLLIYQKYYRFLLSLQKKLKNAGFQVIRFRKKLYPRAMINVESPQKVPSTTSWS